jgi:SecD/SecF fusion protein
VEDQFLDFSLKDTATVNGYFKRADIKILLAADQRYVNLFGVTNNNQRCKIKMLMQ